MAKANRVCHTCGKEYYFCTTCPSDNRDPKVFTMWCGERCKNIFNVLKDENFKKITTSECKNELNKIGLSLDETLKDGIKAHAERVMLFVDEKIKEDIIEEIENEEVREVEVVDTVEPTEEIINNEKPVVKKTYPQKNKRKKK